MQLRRDGRSTASAAAQVLGALLCVALCVACSSGTTTPGDGLGPDRNPGQLDADGALRPDIDATVPDLAPPDLPPPPDPKRAQEVVSGAGLSKSASYELQSQVGMSLGTTLQTGGLTGLRWNAAVIPW